jgi:hypothetical protein
MKRVDWAVAVALFVLALLLRAYRLGEAPLIGDEAYYWLWSEHLQPAYLDHPAGVAMMVRVSTAVAGSSEWGVRWLNAALGAAAAVGCYAVGRMLFSRIAALVSASVIAFSAPYLLVSRFVYTDALQISLLLLNLYLVVPILFAERRNTTWRYVGVGLSMAALLNTKYSAYLYAVVLLAVLVWQRPGLLHERRIWWALGIASLGLAPVVGWNAAHGWVSFRWQWQHFGGGSLDLVDNLRHAVVYLTPPVVLVAAAGATRLRGRAHQGLLVLGLALTVPVLLSPANSPRNLLSGLTLFVLLAGDAACAWSARRRSVVWVAGALVLLLCANYGVGTVAETLRPTRLPHSSVAPELRRQSAGWREARQLPLILEAEAFAIDYHLAGLLWYYGGFPVQSSWPQYRLWQTSEICRPSVPGALLQVFALGYVDQRVVSQRLRTAFATVNGPEVWILGQGDGQTALYVWTAQGCRIDSETFYRWFDLFNLLGDEGFD